MNDAYALANKDCNSNLVDMTTQYGSGMTNERKITHANELI